MSLADVTQSEKEQKKLVAAHEEYVRYQDFSAKGRAISVLAYP